MLEIDCSLIIATAVMKMEGMDGAKERFDARVTDSPAAEASGGR